MAEIDFLKKFVKASGVSGDESGVAGVIAKEIAPYVDEVYMDPMGSLIAHKKGKSSDKKLMFAAHMDEIGFMVNYITDEGYLRVSKIGGINFTASSFSHVTFNNGTHGVLVPEARTAVQSYSPEKVYVDIGAKNKKEAEKHVKIGDFCRVVPTFEKLCGHRVCGRPIDNRIGCYMIFEVAKRMRTCENDTYFVFTCQEEVGVRGSKTSAFEIGPDYGVAVDIGGAGDVINSAPFAVVLGAGPAIKLKDGMVICHKKMVELMRDIAKKDSIKYQLEILESGGTDTCMLQQARGGCVAGAISVPTRYGHSGVETIDMDDVEGGIEIMKGICETVLD
ncbi:MAG: M20/M25/M40 family metallo-hydrolase [Clostridia bacterium]|nr:M20/M25/M40 family metallo-hydrolase [Clostridia bacterium]